MKTLGNWPMACGAPEAVNKMEGRVIRSMLQDARSAPYGVVGQLAQKSGGRRSRAMDYRR